MDLGIAREIEPHAAAAWAACVEATAAAEGNPLGASVSAAGPLLLPALEAVDDGAFNRVIGLGAAVPAYGDLCDAVVAGYAAREQSSYVVEVSPVAEPDDLRDRLSARGLVDSGRRRTRTWQVPALYEGPGMDEVVALGPDDADEFAQVNLIAWELPAFLGLWFGATLFDERFRHFGVRHDGRIIGTGAMYVADGMAWFGFGATLPEHRGRGVHRAILARRVHEAALLGCSLAHADVDSDGSPGMPLPSMLEAGFEHAYPVEWWTPASG